VPSTGSTKPSLFPRIDFASRLFNLGSLMLIVLAAAGFAVLAFNNSEGEGIRSILFFLTPAAWGAFAFASLDGQPKAFKTLGDYAIPGMGVVAGLVISSVVLLKAPVSIANLALGTMAAFFFMMALASAPSSRKPAIPPGEHIWPLAILLMLTVISVAVTVTV
jgi:hypothetical protein